MVVETMDRTPCHNFVDVSQLNIKIDRFDHGDQDGCYYAITHAHSDHIKGLSKRFLKKHPNMRILCTRITQQLLCILLPFLSVDEHFFLVQTNHRYRLADELFIVACASYHCDGSCMFIFQDRTRCLLYTGDFKLTPELLANRVLLEHCFDVAYYDDTFDDSFFSQQGTPCPSDTLCLKQLITLVEDLFKRGPDIALYIHCRILGFEQMLRTLFKYSAIPYKISPNLMHSPRGKQLKLLLPANMLKSDDIKDNRRHITLGDEALDTMLDAKTHWIVPIATWFFCNFTSKELKQNNLCHSSQNQSDFSHKHRLWFMSHPSQQDVAMFKQALNARRFASCQFNVSPLKCLQTS